ncbi:hypothetical protein DEDE109153_11975 [Deinococcus deserti]
MLFPTDHEAAEILKPCEEPFDPPAPLISSEGPAILRLSPITAVGRNHFDTLSRKLDVQLITVIGAVADQSLWEIETEGGVQRVMDQRDFVWTGAGGVDGNRKAVRVGDRHDFGAFTALGLADLEAPFFALTNVASM